jgi:acetyl-CoA carboxylase biotin carboxyl carrier protein
MDPQQIKTFIDAMASSDLAEMEFSQDGWVLRLVRRQAAPWAPTISRAPVGPATRQTGDDPAGAFGKHAATAASTALLAPLFGVVHLRPSPAEPPFVVPGQAVAAGQTLCVIEAMKVFNEVRAERDATVDAVLVTSGQEVEAGQALVRFA